MLGDFGYFLGCVFRVCVLPGEISFLGFEGCGVVGGGCAPPGGTMGLDTYGRGTPLKLHEALLIWINEIDLTPWFWYRSSDNLPLSVDVCRYVTILEPRHPVWVAS